MIKQIWKTLVPAAKWGAIGAVGAVIAISIQANADNHPKESAVEPTFEVQNLKSSDSGSQSSSFATGPWTPANGFADLIEGVSPSVVHVATAGIVERRRSRREFRGPPGFEDFFEDFFNRRNPNRQPETEPEGEGSEDQEEQQTRPLGIGSGFIISEDGYVVTNHHVIDRADEIIVTLTDGTEYDAEIKGSDPRTDLALLKLKDAKNLPFLPWGNDKNSRVGDWVLAIGNPFGLGGSASTGIISAVGRDINAGPYDDFIQVDAAINRGNSGGPLFNMRGEVIGINSMIYSPSGGSVGIGFAIPSSLATGVVSQLRDKGTVERGWIGVQISPVTEDLAKAFNRDNENGALVSQVLEDSPAEKSGIVAGDIILSFDGEVIEEVGNLPRLVAQAPVGKTYKLEIWRDEKLKTLKLKTEPFPDGDAIASSDEEEESEAEAESNSVLDAQLSTLNKANRERYRVGEKIQGVLITGIERGGLADKNSLAVGDVIMQFGSEKSISSPEQVTKAFNAAKKAGRESVALLINRRGTQNFRVFSLK